MEFRRSLLGEEIVVSVDKLNRGMIVHVTGGVLSHVGAVSVADEKGKIQTTCFPGHKDQMISELWADKLFDISKEPVAVVAGIHYENITKDEINKICACTGELLEEVCEKMKHMEE